MSEKKSESKNYLNMHKKLETALLDYDMIREGDHVLVGMSGGKDSTVLLKLLTRKKVALKNRFKISGCFVRQGFKNDDEIELYLREFCKNIEVAFHIIESDALKIIENDRFAKPCYSCSRNRRLELFKYAGKIGANVVAFGHHRDDLIETLFMNIIYSNQIGTISPNSLFFKGEFRLIRPMIYIHEHQIKKEVADSGIKSFSAGCPFEGNSERDFVKSMLKDIYSHRPGAKKSIFRSLFSYDPQYLLKPPSKESVIK